MGKATPTASKTKAKKDAVEKSATEKSYTETTHEKTEKSEKSEKSIRPYNRFMQTELPKVKAENPGMDHKTAFKTVAELWKTSFIADRCRCLTKLCVAWMMDPFDSYVVAKFLVNSPNLTSISCPNCTMEWLTEAVSPILNGHCKNLKHLEVKNWAHESNETCALLEKVAENCSGIVSLHAHLLVTKEIALILIKSFPNLNFFRCHSVTNSGLAILIRGFRKLKSLDLTFDKESHHSNDDEISLAEIGTNFSLLDSFQLSIGNENFPRFALSWTQNQYNLRHIELSLCDGLIDDSFISIIKHCSNLESVQLKWCSRLTDLSYSALAQHRNTRLRQLRIYRSGLTDIGLIEIAKHCPMLLKLDMEHCPEVTQDSLLMVVKNCRRLVKLAGGFPQHTLASLGRALCFHGSRSLQYLKLRDPLYRDSVNIMFSNNFDGNLFEQLSCNHPQLKRLVLR
ncbi:15112_t:CDS:2, partial [Acaulospora colombiana]